MKLKNSALYKDLNSIFLVGEVVDFGASKHKYGITARVRLKIHNGSHVTYIEAYGKKSCSETMAMICQTGNMVYLEGSFKNANVGNGSIKPYILVNHIDCLLRRKDVRPPDTRILEVLDLVDPMGYAKGKENEKTSQEEAELK